MVKGVSKQVIVLHSPEQSMFEQAIFILKEDAAGRDGITDEALLNEAKKLIRSGQQGNQKAWHYGPLWACGGAAVTGLLWLFLLLI